MGRIYLLGKTQGVNTRFSLIASHDVVSEKPLFNQWTPIDAQARSAMHYAQQLIGARRPISVINGFGPSRTSGNTQSKAHLLTGMKQKGDSADYDIDVQTANTYKVFIKQRNTDGSGLKIQLRAQDQNIVEQLNGELMQYLGKVTLTKGLSQLRLEVLANESIKPWAQISGLRRIILVPEHSELDPAEFQLPN